MRWIALGLAVCAAVIAWAAHDLTRTWQNSLRLPEEPDEQ